MSKNEPIDLESIEIPNVTDQTLSAFIYRYFLRLTLPTDAPDFAEKCLRQFHTHMDIRPDLGCAYLVLPIIRNQKTLFTGEEMQTVCDRVADFGIAYDDFLHCAQLPNQSADALVERFEHEIASCKEEDPDLTSPATRTHLSSVIADMIFDSYTHEEATHYSTQLFAMSSELIGVKPLPRDMEYPL